MRTSRRLAPVAMVVVSVASVVSCGGSGDDGDAADDPFGPADEDVSLSIGGDVPDELPADFYLPGDVVASLVDDSDAVTSLSVRVAGGDVASVQADMVAGLRAAGYELVSDDDVAVFVKNGVGRVRVRTSMIVDALTISIDIDKWTDEQLDEMRALLAEPTMVAGRAVAVVDGATYEAVGECRLQGENRTFLSDDASVTVQIDETLDPPRVYADVTTPDGVVYGTENDADLSFSSSPTELTVSGEMTDYTNEGAGSVEFTTTATCSDGS